MRNRLAASALLLLSSACSSGGGTSTVSSLTPALTSPSPNASLKTATATFKLEIPLPPAAASSAHPAYVSAATQSVVITIVSVNGAAPPAGLGPATFAVGPSLSGCSPDTAHPGNYTCTIATPVPPGADKIEISTYSGAGGSGSLLSQQIATATITAGQNYAVAVTLDANPGAVTISAPGNTGISGSQLAGFKTGGGLAQTLNVTFADASGTPINLALPGAPAYSVTSSAPGVASAALNAAAGALTITPGTMLGNTTITITGTPATTTSGLTPVQTTFTLTNAPLIAAGGCSVSSVCTVSMLAYGSGAFTTYGALPAASFGTNVISALGLDGSFTLYAADENNDAIFEFANASIDVPSPGTAPAPAVKIGDANGLNSLIGFDVTSEGAVSTANGLFNPGDPSTDQFVAFPKGSNLRSIGKGFGSNFIGESTAAMPAANGAVSGYATALYDDVGNAGSVGVVLPSGSGSSCDGPSGTVACGLITLGAGNGVSADGAFDLVWDRADQALLIANYNVGANNYSLIQLNWNGTSFSAPVTLSSPGGVISGVYNTNGPWLNVSPDGHVAAVFTTGSLNYDLRVYAPGTGSRTSADINTISQTAGILSVGFLADNTLVVLTSSANGNLCTYNIATQTQIACTTVANAIDAAAAAQSVHRVLRPAHAPARLLGHALRPQKGTH